VITDAPHKIARAIRQDKDTWLIGGEWNAGGDGNKPRDWLNACKEQGFDAKHTAVAWAPLEKQSAFFVFPDKPLKGRPLALMATGRLTQTDVPWLGVFNLGECYWLCGVDNKLAVSPRWEMWGTLEDLEATLNHSDNLGPLGIFRNNRIRFDDPQKAWEWLLESPIQAPMAVPANATQKMLMQGVVAMLILSALGAGGLEGWHWWQGEQAAKQAAKLHAEEAAQQAALQHSAAYLAQQKTALQRRELAYWQTLPRPWEHAPVWGGFLKACDAAAFSVTTQNGWIPIQANCQISPGTISGSMQITWHRSALATVKRLPKGAKWAGSQNDDMVQTTQTLATPGSAQSIVPSPADAQSILQHWTSLSQQWAQSGVVNIAAPTQFSPYVAPIPPFVPQNERKNIHPPVLWQQAIVTLTGTWDPQSGWPMAETGFIPQSIRVDLRTPITWTLTGVLYVANPS
jgi:hypothetical protein